MFFIPDSPRNFFFCFLTMALSGVSDSEAVACLPVIDPDSPPKLIVLLSQRTHDDTFWSVRFRSSCLSDRDSVSAVVLNSSE